MLINPQSRLCESKSTKHPITVYQPFLWLKTNSEQYTVINIDGFVIDKSHRVNGIFKKAEIADNPTAEAFEPEQVFELISTNEFHVLKKFADIFDTSLHTFVWPKDYPTGYNSSDKVIHSIRFSFDNNDARISSAKMVSINDLERGIQMLRGHSFKKVKPLLSASSNVECYLANNTTNPWPGDLDAVIFDHLQQRFTALIEFKTHNRDTPIEDEHIGKYGDQDWRRFSVLFDLIDNFQEKVYYRPKLLFIVWGTNPDSPHHQNIKIDMVERNKVVKTVLLPRPAYNVFSEELFKAVVEFVKGA